jgi:TonB-linked SusC/RagA family outer membrane protein
MKKLLLVCFAWVFALPLLAQERTIAGKVTAAEDRSPLPGVSVLLEGTTRGTVTDADGAFSLSVPDGEGALVFSFIGYVSERVPLTTATNITIVLTADIQSLQEVVVVGYGTVKKNDLTGSVVTIDPEQITKRGTTTPMEGLQGQATGVDISNSTGRAGSSFKIQIRGQQSLSGGQPLYVVDGVITDNIDFLNPQDIERIDILKDASSTAIYGSRGAYGVVIVTTKRGASVKQKAVISYDGYYGVRKAARLPDFMPGDKWWEFRQDSFITGNLQAGTAYDSTIGNNAANKTELYRRVKEKDFTNWPSLLIQNGRQMNHYVTISGMTDNKLGYVIGVGYQEEKANIVHEDFKRYNFKANINHSLNEHWNAGMGMNLSLIDKESGSPNAMVEAFRMSPLVKPYYTDDSSKLILQPGKDLPYIDMTSSVNPLFDMNNSTSNTRTFNGIGNIFLEYLPVKWLSVKTNFQPRFKYDKLGNFNGMNTEGKIGILPDANVRTIESFSYVWDNQISANKTIGSHSFNALGLYSMNLFRDEMMSASATNLPYNSSFYNLGSAPTANQRVASSFSRSTIMSYALRLNYSWKDKYLLTLSNRWDGASVLAPGHKWAAFPSAAVAWKISEEGFLSSVKAINSLKARVSYGLTGNNQAVKPYDTRLTASTIMSYDFNGVAANGYAPGSIVSNGLTWEKVNEVDAGLDFSLFNARVVGSFDYYNKLTSNVTLSRRLTPETGGYFDPSQVQTGNIGVPTVKDNIGKVRNKGIEIAITTTNISTSDFTWTTSFNFSKNQNSIVELDGKKDDIGNKWFIGHPINVNYNYVFDGIWQSGETVPSTQSVGQAKVKDFDGNGVTPDDRRILGTPMPKWIGGMSTTLTYKNFDLSASLFTRQGVQVYSYFHEEFLNFEDRGRAKLNVDWYMPANTVTQTRVSNEYPQPKNGGKYWNTDHVGFYKDASFVKIKNITLGYNFTGALLERTKLRSLRVYFNVLNPFTWTKYNGFDPEWADAKFMDGGMSSITYQMGLNVKF